MSDYREETKKLAMQVFNDERKALEWLRQENVMLSGMRPIDVMQTDDGNVSVRRILAALGSGGRI